MRFFASNDPSKHPEMHGEERESEVKCDSSLFFTFTKIIERKEERKIDCFFDSFNFGNLILEIPFPFWFWSIDRLIVR